MLLFEQTYLEIFPKFKPPYNAPTALPMRVILQHFSSFKGGYTAYRDFCHCMSLPYNSLFDLVPY